MASHGYPGVTNPCRLSGRSLHLAVRLALAPVVLGSLVGCMELRLPTRLPGPAVADQALVPSAAAPQREQIQGWPLTLAAEVGLMRQLQAADQAWIPQAIPLPGGGTRYVYKRRAGEPPLTVPEIRQLMRFPPQFEQEQLMIRAALAELRRAGVRVLLAEPRRRGAAGEWEPRRALLRVRPDVAAKGSREFARVLNHEAIHVAQSCRAGGLRRSPQLIGLSRDLSAQELRHLHAPLYAAITPRERDLEAEAYAQQDQLGLGQQLVASYCRPAVNS